MNRIKQGDVVQVICGKEKGKKGQVLKILKDKDRVIIKGLMLSKHYVKPSQQNKGGIVEKESAIHLSNVMPLDPDSNRPTRVRFSEVNGQKVRVAKSGSALEKRN